MPSLRASRALQRASARAASVRLACPSSPLSTAAPASAPSPSAKAAAAAVPRLALLFPGQGAQRPGMGKDLADAFPQARLVFEEVDEALQERLSRTMFTGTLVRPL